MTDQDSGGLGLDPCAATETQKVMVDGIGQVTLTYLTYLESPAKSGSKSVLT